MTPPRKPSKTNEKSMIRALEPPGTSPERSGTAQDHLKASLRHQESFKTAQSGLQDAQSGLQDAMLCARGADLCARRAILCACGTILSASGKQKTLKFYWKNKNFCFQASQTLVPARRCDWVQSTAFGCLGSKLGCLLAVLDLSCSDLSWI